MRQSLSADGRWLARASWNPALSVYDLAGPEPREQRVAHSLLHHAKEGPYDCRKHAEGGQVTKRTDVGNDQPGGAGQQQPGL